MKDGGLWNYQFIIPLTVFRDSIGGGKKKHKPKKKNNSNKQALIYA